eukprot:4203199-Lingulodinium_polyedra.AAC.1
MPDDGAEGGMAGPAGMALRATRKEPEHVRGGVDRPRLAHQPPLRPVVGEPSLGVGRGSEPRDQLGAPSSSPADPVEGNAVATR